MGLHPVTVTERDGDRLRVEPLEAVDGTPVIDIKVELGPPGSRGPSGRRVRPGHG